MRSWNDIDQQIDSIPENRKLEIDLAAYLVEQIVMRRRQLGITQAQGRDPGRRSWWGCGGSR